MLLRKAYMLLPVWVSNIYEDLYFFETLSSTKSFQSYLKKRNVSFAFFFRKITKHIEVTVNSLPSYPGHASLR